MVRGIEPEAQNRDAWIISTPGNREVIVECLPGSAWPDVLAKRGCRLEETEDGERIIPTAIREPMVINADGTLACALFGRGVGDVATIARGAAKRKFSKSTN